MIKLPSNVRVIGVTGGIGSGKSTFAELLAEKGGTHVDGDQLAREAVLTGSAALKQIVEAFGEDLIDDEGSLKRRELGARIFEDPKAKTTLEHILHPVILQLLQKRIKTGPWPIIYEATLLFEAEHHLLTDLNITLSAQPSIVTERVKTRDNLTQSAILSRLSSQNNNAWREARADVTVTNNHGLSLLQEKAASLWHHISEGSCRELY